MSEPLFDVPNLDDLSVEPCDYREAAKVFELLTKYASHKALAMEYRLVGGVQAAAVREREMARLYGCLPEWARW